MLTFTAKLTKKRLAVLIGTLLIIPLIFVAAASAAAPAVKSVSGATPEERAAFLSQFGWQTESSSEEVRDILIPAVFDKVYTTYNELQNSQKFDLAPYKGKQAKCYTIKVINYPEDSETVYAALLVVDGRIVGGDIHSTALDGFMHGFDLSGTGMKIGQYSTPQTTKPGSEPTTTMPASSISTTKPSVTATRAAGEATTTASASQTTARTTAS